MQDRLDVAPVRPEQQPLAQLTFVGWAGKHVVDADGEGMRVFLARLVVRWLWHVTSSRGMAPARADVTTVSVRRAMS